MNPELDANVLRKTACDLVRLGGQTAQRYFGKVIATRKADDTPVTEADLATQETILKALAEIHPSHAILVEEHVSRPDLHASVGQSDYCWVVDPIDGTRNYARRIGVYAISVAVLHEGRPLAGAVYDATTGTIYSAARGGGAFHDSQLMSLSERSIDSDTTIMISSFRRRQIPDAVRRWMDRFLFRNQGSLCLHLVWVAAGLADAAYALECKLWDIAAAALIVEQAGGRITDHVGNPLWPIDPAEYHDEDLPILVGSKSMHRELLSTLGDHPGKL